MFTIEETDIANAIEKAKVLHPKVRMIEFGKYEVTGSQPGSTLHSQVLARRERPEGCKLQLPHAGWRGLQAWHGGCGSSPRDGCAASSQIAKRDRKARARRLLSLYSRPLRKERISELQQNTTINFQETARRRLTPGDRVLIYDQRSIRN